MKKIGLTLMLICVLTMSTLLPVYATDEVSPLAFGTFTDSFDTTVTIPSHTTSNGKYFSAHSYTYKTVYSVSYNLNNGEIASARILRHEFYPDQVQWGEGLAQALSMGVNSYTATISADKYSVAFKYQSNIVVRYYHFPGGPSEDDSLNFNLTKTITPHTP